MRYVLPCILWFCLVSAQGHAANSVEVPGSGFQSGYWDGAAYLDGETGRFSHCLVSAEYEGGHTLYFSVGWDATVSVAIWIEDPIFEEGQRIPVRLSVDRRAPFYGEALAVSANSAYITIFEFDRAMTAFKKGRELQLTTDGWTSVYDLVGSHRALDSTLGCAKRYIDYAAAPAPEPDTATGVDKSILYQIATYMIADIGVSDFEYLSDAEMKQYSGVDAVAWVSASDNMSGAVMLYPAEDFERLNETDASDLAGIAEDCRGDMVSGARDIDTEEFQVREIQAVCRQDDITTESFISKTLLDDLVLRVFLTVAYPNDAPADLEQDPDPISEDFIARAASLVATTRR